MISMVKTLRVDICVELPRDFILCEVICKMVVFCCKCTDYILNHHHYFYIQKWFRNIILLQPRCKNVKRFVSYVICSCEVPDLMCCLGTVYW